jgi:probable rRNA maturation factor
MMQLSIWYENEDIPSHCREEMEGMLARIAPAIANAVDVPVDSENYHIILTSQDYIRRLNRDFRCKDCVTDVLSFPLGSEEEITGEIYICWDRINSQASEYGHSWQREFSYLLVHGILHLLGFEHGDEPNPAMRELEEKILEHMGMGR